MDTLSHIRKVKRFVESQNRKELKRRMNGYNGLASARGGVEGLGDSDSPDTIHDISQRLIEQCQVRAQAQGRSRFVRRVSQVDRITANAVCDEVRRTWNEKLHANTQLNDETRAKLARSSIGGLRESKLNDLAKWMVAQWCDVEGYDPVLHTEERCISMKHVECETKYECEHLHIV